MHPRPSICALIRRSALLLCAMLGSTALLCFPSHAQTHKVEAPENVTRAIGVYEWTGEIDKPTASRLIPVSLFIDSKFQDAGIYLAHPVPWVLQPGNVYSVERAGENIGTLNIDYARDIVTRHSADDDPLTAWYGYGKFLTPTEEAKLAPLHSAKPPVVVSSIDGDTDDSRPQFIRRQPSTTTPATPAKPGSTTSTPSPAPDDDPDRPTLRHRDPADATAKPNKKDKPTGYVTPPNTSLNDDPNRPALRRGIPTGTLSTAQLAGMPPNLHQSVAISDAANHDPHIFTREWATSSERAQTLNELEALAQPRLAKYIATNKLTPATASQPGSRPAFATSHQTPAASTTPATRQRTRKPAAPPPPQLALANEELSGYTLSYGGLPTFIYTVESPITDGGPIYLTLVAQRLPTGELQVALSSVTDATHLDRTPWLRPIDVVDPDWSHRASLLFELRAQSSRQFALYRLTTPEAEQTFITGIIE
jgi:hypothetical protein